MNKKTVIIVCVSLLLSLVAISVIATFPSYLFENIKTPASTDTNNIQSDNISEPTQGDDIADVGGDNAVEGIMPGIDNDDIGLPIYPIEDYEVVAQNKGVSIIAEAGAFKADTEFKIDKLGLFDKKYYRARHYIRDFAKKHSMYDITAKKDGTIVTPLGIAKVVLQIPQNYDLEKVEVYYLLSAGNVTKLDAVINKTDKTATVSFTQSGVYILVERKQKVDSATSNTTTSDSSSPSSSETENSSNISSSDKNDNDSTQSSSSSGSSSNESSKPSEPEESDPYKETMNGWTPWY